MATSVTAAGRPAAPADANLATRLVQWARGHRQATAYLGIVVAVGAVLFVWNLWTTRTAERAAGARLGQACRAAGYDPAGAGSAGPGTEPARRRHVETVRARCRPGLPGAGVRAVGRGVRKRRAPQGGRRGVRAGSGGGAISVLARAVSVRRRPGLGGSRGYDTRAGRVSRDRGGG